MLNKIIASCSLLAVALACGNSSSSSSGVTASAVVISGVVDDATGLSKPRFKISSTSLSMNATDLSTSTSISSDNLNYDPTTGAYSIQVSPGTALAINLVSDGQTLLSRLLSPNETASSVTKNVGLVTHLQAQRALQRVTGGESVTVALQSVNDELFGKSTPAEDEMVITKLPQSMQVALLTYREAATLPSANPTSFSVLQGVLLSNANDFNTAYNNAVNNNNLTALTIAAIANNSDLIASSVFAAVTNGTANELPGGLMITANYRLTFQAEWSSSTHDSLPDNVNAHFSKMIGFTHNSGNSLFTVGEAASAGIKNMAETGSTIPLDSEIEALVSSGDAGSLLVGSGSFNSPGSGNLNFSISSDNALVSLVTMIAPSPDWFGAIEGVNLMGNGVFLPSKTVDVFPYDAGTDSGATFTSSDNTTSPQGVIAKISGSPFLSSGSLRRLGTITLEKL